MKQKRFLIIELLLFLFAAVIIGRLFYWQVLKYDNFLVAAKDQTENTVYLGAKRGKILASDGSALVSNQKAYLVYAIIPEIKELKKDDKSYDELVKRISGKIAPILLKEKLKFLQDIDKKDKDKLSQEIKSNIILQLKQENLVWVPLAKKVGEPAKEKLQSLKIKGIGFEDDTKRFYAEGNFAANLLGFVAKDSAGNDKGYFGLEGYYDDKLKGKSGKLIQEVDALGRPILIAPTIGRDALDGSDLLTTIERTVQFTVEEKLRDGVKRFGASSGAVIVLDVKTGALLASASFPSFNIFDPNKSKQQYYKNFGISEVYEPGSAFKSITISSALDSGSIDVKTICPCKGPIKVAGYEIQTVDNKYHPNSKIVEILQHSDNVGAAFTAKKMGIDTFLKYLTSFGLGEVSGIDLQGEEAGIVKERQNWGDVELVTAAFGQGVSVTGLQMVNALSAIANDGVLMKPYVVQKIIGPKTTVEFKPKKIRDVIRPETAQIMKQLLLAAVEGGEAKNLIPHGYRVAGKTGTAQVPIAGKYSTKTVASFVGFGPVEKPKFAMIVVLFEPSASIFAADTAEPLFFDIIEQLYPYWGIPVEK